MKEIPFIYADGCLDCNRMETMLKKAIRESGKTDYIIKAMDSETDAAIDFAVKRGIEDIPACAIGETVLYGKNGFTYEAILKAFNELQ